jgi:hypothetical protein
MFFGIFEPLQDLQPSVVAERLNRMSNIHFND